MLRVNVDAIIQMLNALSYEDTRGLILYVDIFTYHFSLLELISHDRIHLSQWQNS